MCTLQPLADIPAGKGPAGVPFEPLLSGSSPSDGAFAVIDWELRPADMDRKTRRLFIGCNNEKMAMADADSGKIVTTLPIGVYVDATAFDPATGPDAKPSHRKTNTFAVYVYGK